MPVQWILYAEEQEVYNMIANSINLLDAFNSELSRRDLQTSFSGLGGLNETTTFGSNSDIPVGLC